MGWKLYKSTDTGAPNPDLSTNGALITILDACLIDGYGSGADEKTPVGGWSHAFPTANNVAVYRADAGDRQFYRIDDNSGDVDVTRMIAYESMSDLNTGLGQWFSGYFGKHYASSYPDNWIVLANEYSVWIFFAAYLRWGGQFFGEYDSLFSGATYNSGVIGHGSLNYFDGAYQTPLASAGSMTTTLTTISTGLTSHRLPDGTGLGTILGIHNPTNMTFYSRYRRSIVQFPAKKPLLFPVYLCGYPNTAFVGSGEDFYQAAMFWGSLPKLYFSDVCVRNAKSDQYGTAEWIDTDSGKTFLCIPAEMTNWSTTEGFDFMLDITGL